MKDFSVIIVSKDRYAKLKRACTSVFEKLVPTSVLSEIVIIDNGSLDATSTLTSSDFPSSVRVLVEHNLALEGVARNRNMGVSLGTGEFVIFLDDDAYIEHLDVDAVRKFFRDNPTVSIIAPHIVYPGGGLQESVRSFPSIPALLWRGLQLYRFAKPSWYRKYVDPIPHREHCTEPVPIDWAIGACQIVRRNLFDTIGPLDEGYFFGYEDVAMCFRAKRAGLSTVYWPHSTIVHEYARTSAKLFSRAMWRHVRSIVRFFLSR